MLNQKSRKSKPSKSRNACIEIIDLIISKISWINNLSFFPFHWWMSGKYQRKQMLLCLGNFSLANFQDWKNNCYKSVSRSVRYKKNYVFCFVFLRFQHKPLFKSCKKISMVIFYFFHDMITITTFLRVV